MRVFLSRAGALHCYRARAGEKSFSSPFAAGRKAGIGMRFSEPGDFPRKGEGGAGAASGEAHLHLSGRMPASLFPDFRSRSSGKKAEREGFGDGAPSPEIRAKKK